MYAFMYVGERLMRYTNKQDLLEQLAHMQSEDVRNIDPENVSEISDVEIDKNLSVKERVNTLLMQTKNPYVYKVNGIVVKVSFSESGKTLQSCMEEYLAAEMLAG